MAEVVLWAFPDGGKIAKNMTWKRESTIELGPIGTFKAKSDFTYKGIKDKKDMIGIRTNLEYVAPVDKAGLPFIIRGAKLKSERGEGEAVFDREKGRFASSRITMNLKGTINIEVNNQATDVDFEQTQEAISETSDTHPWVKKPAPGVVLPSCSATTAPVWNCGNTVPGCCSTIERFRLLALRAGRCR
jgi:hypothetical protein